MLCCVQSVAGRQPHVAACRHDRSVGSCMTAVNKKFEWPAHRLAPWRRCMFSESVTATENEAPLSLTASTPPKAKYHQHFPIIYAMSPSRHATVAITPPHLLKTTTGRHGSPPKPWARHGFRLCSASHLHRQFPPRHNAGFTQPWHRRHPLSLVKNRGLYTVMQIVYRVTRAKTV